MTSSLSTTIGAVMPGRVVDVVLEGEQRETLERWARRPKSSQALAFRCRVVLAAAEGRSSTEIAAELGCAGSTVGKWRGRFARRGIDGLHDEPRPGKPRSISDEDVERVIVKTLEEQPANATHWSTRSMAAATGMSQSAVSRIWRAFGLKPHRVPRQMMQRSSGQSIFMLPRLLPSLDGLNASSPALHRPILGRPGRPRPARIAQSQPG